MSKRVLPSKIERPGLWIPDASPEAAAAESDDRVLWGRQVEGASIGDLNQATHGLGKKIPRVLDVFVMGLIHAYRLSEMKKESPLEDIDGDGLAQALNNLHDKAPSLYEPVVADVMGVKSSRREVAVYIDYPTLTEEQFVLARTIGEYLNLPHMAAPGPREPHIVLIEEPLARDEQVRRVEGALPDQINLSAMKPIG